MPELIQKSLCITGGGGNLSLLFLFWPHSFSCRSHRPCADLQAFGLVFLFPWKFQHQTMRQVFSTHRCGHLGQTTCSFGDGWEWRRRSGLGVYPVHCRMARSRSPGCPTPNTPTLPDARRTSLPGCDNKMSPGSTATLKCRTESQSWLAAWLRETKPGLCN